MTRTKLEMIGVLAAALVIGCLIAPFASGSPDGYERVAMDTGFESAFRDSVTATSPLADYSMGPVSVIVGLAIIAAAGTLIANTVRRS